MGLPTTELDLKAELARCKTDTGYFRWAYLPVVDRDTAKKVRFRLREAQQIVLKAITDYQTTYVLKPRRTGISRAVFSRMYGKVRWTADLPAISVFHNDEDAVKAFEQVRDWERQLPGWMRQGPFALETDRDQMLRWKHGGVMAIVSAGSKPAGSYTWWYRHYSEFAKFKDPETTIRLIEGGAAQDGRAIFETTSEGAGAYAHQMWRADNGWGKVFLPWFMDLGYQTDTKKIPHPYTLEDLLTSDVVEYGREFSLSKERLVWLALRLRKMGYKPEEGDASSAWLSFHREFPATPELAFRAARGRVFKPHYPSARPERGHRRYVEREPYRVYSMGLDAAGGGEDGDFSTWVVSDVTDRQRPRLVSSFYDKLEVGEFIPWVLRELEHYVDCMYVGERDGWAKGVQDAVLERGHPHVWREVYFDRINKKTDERLGRTASNLANKELVILEQEYINGGKYDDSGDLRLRYEINDFGWNDKGIAEAQKPNHDDMIRALGLSLLGMDQIETIKVTAHARRPVTLAERIAERMRDDYDSDNPPVYDDEFEAWGGRDLLTSITDDVGLGGR